MSLKAGRVGVNPSDVDPINGHINTSAYTKTEADAKFATLNQVNGLPAYNSVNSLIEDTVGWVGKNEFDGKATTTTDQYGLTWTVDESDKNDITVSGTPTGFAAFNVQSTHILEAGDYIVSGISDAVNVAFNAIALFKNNNLVRMLSEVGTDNQTITINANDDYDTIRIGLKRKSNNVACSGTIRLMIRKAEITDNTYEPYHKSVEEVIMNIPLSMDLLTGSQLKDVVADSSDFSDFKTKVAAM